MSENFISSPLAQDVLSFHCPRYAELPVIDLYMDQVVGYIEGVLSVFVTTEEKMLTSSMVNNYVKQKVVMPPLNKKYSRTHLMYLIAVCALKKILSIPEICGLIRMFLDRHEPAMIYNFFCDELEGALRATFTAHPDDSLLPRASETEQDADKALARSVALCLANKIYIQKLMQYEEEKSRSGAKKQ